VRVVCRDGIAGGFEETVERVAEAVGVVVSDDVVRRMTAGIGAVAAAEVPAAMACVARGQPAWPASAPGAPPQSGGRAVAVAGLYVHRDDGWHERKVVTVAPLGPGVEGDADTGRERLVGGQTSHGAGCAEAQAFWGRTHVEAGRRGLGTPAVHTVGVLGDGAAWIWGSARAFLGLSGVEVGEIIDLYHADEYLWGVGTAVFAAETAAAAAWVEPLTTRRYAQGAAPRRAALEALAPTVGATAPAAPEESAAAPAVRRALESVTTNAARLDYPTVGARRWPIGAGAVESACKSVVQARTKGAGLRWRGAGAPRVVAVRALHRSGRWDAFWQTQPQRARLLLCPRARRRPAALAAPPPHVVPPVGPRAAPVPPVPAGAPAPPRPLRPAADHPWRRQPIGRARSA
jgi:hypothetical protein